VNLEQQARLYLASSTMGVSRSQVVDREVQLQEKIANYQEERVLCGLVSELCHDSRWTKLMEWADAAMLANYQRMDENAENHAKVCGILGENRILKSLRMRESALKRQAEILDRKIQELRDELSSFQTMPGLGPTGGSHEDERKDRDG